MKYEDGIERLDRILTQIEESGDLERSVELYEEGVTVAKDCLEELKRVKGKITVLQQDLDKLIERGFDLDEDR